LENEKNLSRLDFLTQVSNRRAFSEILQIEAARSRRYKRPLTLAYIDLDNLEQVNDHLGHETGDKLLCLVAQTIVANIRVTIPSPVSGETNLHCCYRRRERTPPTK
jgi:diguanylate cyclase (GGDEF)-like protein